MSANPFQRASRQRVALKLAVTGPSGSGKTYGALLMAFGLGAKVAVIDTENGSASLYAHLGEFDTLVLTAPFTAEKYIAAIKAAVAAGYEVLVIDSLTHLWKGDGGLLHQKEAKDARGGNSYTNWHEITKFFEQFKSALLQSPMHVIATIRSKQDYVIEQDSRGKSAPKKVGLAPEMRDGIEYEFTTVFDVAMNHESTTSKDRTGLFDGQYFTLSRETGEKLRAWQESGAEFVQQPEFDAPPPPPSNGNGRYQNGNGNGNGNGAHHAAPAPAAAPPAQPVELQLLKFNVLSTKPHPKLDAIQIEGQYCWLIVAPACEVFAGDAISATAAILNKEAADGKQIYVVDPKQYPGTLFEVADLGPPLDADGPPMDMSEAPASYQH